MATSELQSVVNRWTQIAGAFNAAKKPPGLWKPLAQQDIGNVLQGRSSMANGEIIDQLAAGMKQHSIVSQSQDQPSTNPLDIAGNFLGDVGSIAWNFVPGVIHYATTLPEQAQDFVKLAQGDQATQQKYGMEAGGEGGIGGFLRNMSRVPVFGPLIPGLHTAAAVTTPQGREEILAHPGFAALDVAPVVGEAGKLGALGRGAEAGTALEALQTGNPFKATGRGVMDVASHLPGVPARAQVFNTLANAGLSSDIIKGVLKPLAVGQRAAEHKVISFTRDSVVPELEKFAKEDPAGYAMFNRALQTGSKSDLAALPVEQQVLVDHIDHLNEQWRQASDQTPGGTTTVMSPAGTWETFAADSPIATLDHKLSIWTDRYNNQLGRLAAAGEEVEKRQLKLEGNIGRVRKFGESDEAMAERYRFQPEHPITLQAIHDSMVPLIESFQLDPRRIYQGIDQLDTAQARTAIGKDINLLEGHDGAFSQLQDAMQSGDIIKASRTLTQINRVFKHPVWEQTRYADTFRSYLNEMRQEMVGLRQKVRAHGYAARTLSSAQMRLESAGQKATQYLAKKSKLSADLQQEYLKSAPQRFHPLIEQRLRSGVAQKLQESVANASDTAPLLHGLTMDKALQEIATSPLESALAKYVGPDVYKEMRADSVAFWQTFAKEGYNPRWIHNVDSATVNFIDRPRLVAGEFHKPAQFRDAVFNLGRTMNNVSVGLTATEMELARMVGQKAFIDEHLMPLTSTVEKELPSYVEAVRGTNPEIVGENLNGMARAAMMKDYVPFDPNRYGWARFIKITKGQELLLPKGVAKALDQMGGRGLPFSGRALPGMGIYKMAVLTGPRHMAHVGFGGLTFMAVREPGAIRFIGAAHRMLKNGEFFPEIQQSLHNLHDDGLFHYATGRSMGRMLKAIPEAANRLEQMWSDSYKVAVMLKGEASGLTHEQALGLANKVLIDMDNMTAFERNIAKTVFPFYGFTKHILRYAFTMPVDHPIRTAILSNLSRIEQKDRGDSLPGTFNMLFFLGEPDSNGNVNAIDYKSVNPFRSMYNTFTLAGVLSSVNPYLSATMEASGLNVLSATPELYPDLQVDPQTGQIVAKHNASDIAMTALNAFVPEFSALDATLQLTNRMKGLKASNPDAFHRALWSSLNMPFSLSGYNIPHEIQRLERKRYKAAQSDVSAAMQSGDFSDVMRYGVVPVPSLLRPYLGGSAYAAPELLATVWHQIQAHAPAGVNVKGLIPRH